MSKRFEREDERGFKEGVKAERLKNKKIINCMLATLRKEQAEKKPYAFAVYQNQIQILENLLKRLEKSEKELLGKYVIVRADRAGVFAGTLTEKKGEDKK